MPELESAWLFKIAHNVCLSRRRSSWRRGRVESPADFEAVEELTPAPSRAADELIGLQDVLEQMPESQRRAILLREWQGLSYREIAAELELSQGAVETLIFRARRALATGLEEPPERTKRRLLRGVDLGSLVAGLKALLIGGGGAAKVAAAVAVVSVTTAVAADPVVQRQHHPHRSQPVRAPVQKQQSKTRREPGSTVAPAAGVPTGRLTPARHLQTVTHPAVSKRGSAAGRPALVPAAAKKQHPAAGPRSAKAHAKPTSARSGTTTGSKGVHRAVAKGHAARVRQRHMSHTSPKVRPKASAPKPVSAPAPAVPAQDVPAQPPRGVHDGSGKTKDQTG